MSQTFNTCFKFLTCFSRVYVTNSTCRPTKCCHRPRVSTSYLHYKLRILCEDIWDKVFKNGPTRICGIQPLKNFTWSILEYFVPYFLVQNASKDSCYFEMSLFKIPFEMTSSFFTVSWILSRKDRTRENSTRRDVALKQELI